MTDYRQYGVWKKAHSLTVLAYQATKGFPDTERYGLISQTRRAAASIPMNIAEGLGRSHDRDRARFIDIAIGSSNEFEYQIILSRDLDYLDSGLCDELTAGVMEVRRMLTALRSRMLG